MLIQGGASGIVIGGTAMYRTAFFEAFPDDPATFLRGEGLDVAAAEAAAWIRYQEVLACASHEPERGGYRNGAGICRHCSMFMANVFEPLNVTHEERAEVAVLLGGVEGRSFTELSAARAALTGPAAKRASVLHYALSEIIADAFFADDPLGS